MRNKLLDVIRLIAAFMVILIHSPIPGIAGQVFESISRMAVPFFFMISGYYAYGKTKEKVLKSTKNIAVMLVWSVILYFIWGFLWSLYKRDTITYLINYFSLNSLVETIVFNNGIILGHLWFLLALLYCYLIYIYIFRKTSSNTQVGFSTLLLICFFVIRELLKFNGVQDPIYYLRNFLFIGLPFFLLGTLISKFHKSILRINLFSFIFIIVFGIAASIAERFTLGCCDLYIGTTIFVVALFALVQRENIIIGNKLFATLGERYSGYIYVFHSLVITIVNAAGSVFNVLESPLFQWVRPIIVLIISLCIAFIVVYVRSIYSKRFKKHAF